MASRSAVTGRRSKLSAADAAAATATRHEPIARLASCAMAGVSKQIMGEGAIPATNQTRQRTQIYDIR